jgi:hypothetical protein
MFSHLPFSAARVAAPQSGRSNMTLFYAHHDRPHGSAGTRHRSLARALRRVGGALKMIHRAIAAAKIHRLRNELILHAGAYDWAHTAARDGHTETDVTKYPRRPLILGDKWDF